MWHIYQGTSQNYVDQRQNFRFFSSGIRNSEFLVLWGFFYNKNRRKKLWLWKMSDLPRIPVYWRSGIAGFYCSIILVCLHYLLFLYFFLDTALLLYMSRLFVTTYWLTFYPIMFDMFIWSCDYTQGFYMPIKDGTFVITHGSLAEGLS